MLKNQRFFVPESTMNVMIMPLEWGVVARDLSSAQRLEIVYIHS